MKTKRLPGVSKRSKPRPSDLAASARGGHCPMQLTAQAIVVASRPHGETAAIVRILTSHAGLIAAYVAGARGRQLRPVVIPGNMVAAELRAKSPGQLPFARLELVESRGPWLSEPLPAAAVGWATALTAASLPENEAHPEIYAALGALLTAICHAGAAREWVRAMLAYEALMLRALGFGGGAPPHGETLATVVDRFHGQRAALSRHIFTERQADILTARDALAGRLVRLL